MISGLDLDWYYLGLAKYISRLGTCSTKKVGCVVVHRGLGVPIALGYNAAPRGTAPCGDECANRSISENSKVCRAVHAEINAVLNAAYVGVSVVGSIMYVTISPCQSCARFIIQSGVSEVVSAAMSPYTKAVDLLKEAGIKFRVVTGVSRDG